MIILDMAALTLATIHFGVPLAYYAYIKKWLNKPWNIKKDPNYKPKVTIIIPTYNEAKIIQKRLENIYQQKYPKEKIELIIVDSASTDGTPEKVKQWAIQHPDTKITLIQEEKRRGKARALNHALKRANGEIVVVGDADSFWEENALSNAISYLADPRVGAVSCLKKPQGRGLEKEIEENYRNHYNVLRICESKAYSTPTFHGELAAFRKKLLEKIGGFPTYTGSDDSHAATKIALMGYRAIIPEDVWATELVPNGKDYFWWRLRRAMHLQQNLYEALKIKAKTDKNFKKILNIEAYLHLTNPWLIPIILAVITINIAQNHTPIGILMLILGTVLLLSRNYRTWLTTQIYLIIASLRNLYTKDIVWKKSSKYS